MLPPGRRSWGRRVSRSPSRCRRRRCRHPGRRRPGRRGSGVPCSWVARRARPGGRRRARRSVVVLALVVGVLALVVVTCRCRHRGGVVVPGVLGRWCRRRSRRSWCPRCPRRTRRPGRRRAPWWASSVGWSVESWCWARASAARAWPFAACSSTWWPFLFTTGVVGVLSSLVVLPVAYAAPKEVTAAMAALAAMARAAVILRMVVTPRSLDGSRRRVCPVAVGHLLPVAGGGPRYTCPGNCFFLSFGVTRRC